MRIWDREPSTDSGQTVVLTLSESCSHCEGGTTEAISTDNLGFLRFARNDHRFEHDLRIIHY